jgi:predicted secreted protein
MRHKCQHQQALLSKQGRHRRFPRYPIVHLPCPELSGVRLSRSESVLNSDQVYHSLRFRCKLAAFTVVYHFDNLI